MITYDLVHFKRVVELFELLKKRKHVSIEPYGKRDELYKELDELQIPFLIESGQGLWLVSKGEDTRESRRWISFSPVSIGISAGADAASIPQKELQVPMSKLLERCAEERDMSEQWKSITTASNAAEHAAKAIALLELAEVADCGSVGGFGKGQKYSNQFEDRLNWLLNKYGVIL